MTGSERLELTEALARIERRFERYEADTREARAEVRAEIVSIHSRLSAIEAFVASVKGALSLTKVVVSALGVTGVGAIVYAITRVGP